MFIAALVLRANDWKHPKTILSTGKWINKLRYSHTIEYDSIKKKYT